MSDESLPTRRARKAVGDGVPPLPADAALADLGAPEGTRAADADISDVDEHRLPTAQLERAAFGDHVIPWAPPVPPRPPSLAPWALGLAVVALATSLFVAWTLPLGVIAAVAAIISLRRPFDSRRVAVWALVLSAVSIVYSVGWLLWALPQLPTD